MPDQPAQNGTTPATGNGLPSEPIYCAPFGRYEGSDAAAPPDNESLIGRRDQRSQLLNLLFTQGRRGAYLVTGHRGSGKTSFVEHCIGEYRDDILGRFLRSNVGRAFLFDRLALLGFAALTIAALLVLRGVLHFVVHLWVTEPHPWLRLVVGVPLVFALGYPILMARDFLSVAMHEYPQRDAQNGSKYVRYLMTASAVAVLPFVQAHIIEPFKAGALIILGILLFFASALHSIYTPGKDATWIALPVLRMTLLAGAGMLLVNAHPPPALISILLLFAASLCVEGALQRASRNAAVRAAKLRLPCAMLALKAFVFFMFGVHLLMPFLEQIHIFAQPTTFQPNEIFQSEVIWWATTLVLVVIIAGFEYEWIVKSHRRIHAGVSLDRGATPTEEHHRSSRRLVESTFFWFIYGTWLPVINVSINLGVEPLDHRRVIEAMLMGLRDSYMKAFIERQSPLAHALRIGRIGLLIMATTLVGDHIFKAGGATAPIDAAFTDVGHRRIIDLLRVDILAHPPQVVASVEGAANADVFGGRARLSDFMLPTSLRQTKTGRTEHVIEIRVYHVLIFGLLLAIGAWVARRWPIFPYQRTNERLHRFIDSLSSKLHEESKTSIQFEKLQEIMQIGHEKSFSKETDPLDPRTVELSFLALLRDIQDPVLRLPFSHSMAISIPAPEIIFVFDELDKVGVKRGSDKSADTTEVGTVVGWDEERERSHALHSLLADMKNILSSAPARFIFVGGRNLHDEWLADQTARQPLLTRMFNDEVYVPSLLTDSLTAAEASITTGASTYVEIQLHRANQLFNRWTSTRYAEWLRLARDERKKATFVSANPRREKLHIYKCAADKWQPAKDDRFNERFTEFLTYRSMGNVKRLSELVEGFIRPAEQIQALQNAAMLAGEAEVPSLPQCEHVLFFTDVDRHRIQLIADVFQNLFRAFAGSEVWRDDKLAPAVFYLADFLLKFHRRAFTQNNLERVDELVHIHRAPDLRPVLHDIVATWAGPILHPIRNGMYAYRFRSDFAAELRLASRGSDEELAALNFTLDESQSLKDLYKRRLAGSTKTTAYEFEAAIGELHEFDEEYELARFHYRNAIDLIDEQLAKDVGLAQSESPFYKVIARTDEGIEIARRRAHWGVGRLRLMLQLGMTHESAKDFESAMIDYRNAGMLAHAMLEGWLEQIAPGERTQPVQTLRSKVLDEQAQDATLIKQLDILLQPTFAQAWVAEKSGVGIDSGAELIERDLAALRARLPFVQESFEARRDPTVIQRMIHPNFAIVMAELHDKAGDFFFTKGKQVKPRDNDENPALPGYLTRAHHHYAVALHEIRAFNRYRRETLANTIASLGWPDFPLQVAAGALCDLGEALLASVSMSAVVNTDQEKSSDLSTANVKSRADAAGQLVQTITQWLDDADSDEVVRSNWRTNMQTLSGKQQVGSLQEWFGTPSNALLDISPPKDEGMRLLVSLLVSLAGASVLARDGRNEDATREALQVAETAGRLLSWWAILHRLSHSDAKSATPLWYGVWAIGWYALSKAAWRYRRKPTTELAAGPADDVVGELVRTAETRATCALRLAAVHVEGGGQIEGIGDTPKNTWPRNASEALLHMRASLEGSGYPMLHRLRTLQILVIHEALQNQKDEAEQDLRALQRLEARYRTRLQFTPFDVAVPLAMVARLTGNEADKNNAFDLLKTSQQMHTMRRAYYETISDMHYLYDDFNDRRVHYNHAIQMAGADITTELLKTISPYNKESDDHDGGSRGSASSVNA